MKINSVILVLMCFVSVFLFDACANLGDKSEELGGGYSYRIDGTDRWINTDHTMKQMVYPNVIDYAFDNDFIVIAQAPSKTGYKRLLSQDLKDKYSIFIDDFNKSISNDPNEQQFLNSRLWRDKNIHDRVSKEIRPDNNTNVDSMDLIADSIINFDPFFKKYFLRKKNYWIIEKKRNLVLGPFSKEEYFKMRQELTLPKTLELKELLD